MHLTVTGPFLLQESPAFLAGRYTPEKITEGQFISWAGPKMIFIISPEENLR